MTHNKGRAIRLLKTITLLTAAQYAFASTPGTWATTGSLNIARTDFAQIRLADGRVLAAGGKTATGLTVTAEIFDPATGLWSLTGNLTTARALAGAILLSGGKVLIAGGYTTGGAALSSTEIFDPATSTFTPGVSMLNARAAFTPLQLQSGKILVAGGCPAGVSCSVVTPNAYIPSFKTVEIYDPVANTWSLTGSMNTARARVTPVLLSSGKVFVTANIGINVFTQFDLYDPSTGVWTAIGPNLYPAPSLAVGLNNGKVIAFAGGSATYVYDPVANTFTAGPALLTSHIAPAAVLLANGKVLVAGGGVHTVNGGGRGGARIVIDGDSELYNPTTNTFTSTGASTPHGWIGFLTQLNNDTVLLTGGVNSDLVGALPIASADLYSPATEALSPASVTFAGQLLGTTSSAQTVTLSNLTSLPLAVTGIATTGDFSQTNTCVGYVAAGQTCSVSVSFTPTAAGARTGAINVTLGDAPFADSIALSGTGLNQALSVSPGSLTLATVAGTTTTTVATVSNVSASATPVAVSLSGVGFSQTNNCTATLNAGASCAVTVTFAPTANAIYSGQLTLTGTGGALAVPLNGTGSSVALAVTPSSLNSGAVQVNDNPTKSITVTNATPVAFTIAVAISGPPFTITRNCAASLAAGKSCTITVEYQPTAVTIDSGTVTVTDNTGTVNVVTLAGQGTP